MSFRGATLIVPEPEPLEPEPVPGEPELPEPAEPPTPGPDPSGPAVPNEPAESPTPIDPSPAPDVPAPQDHLMAVARPDQARAANNKKRPPTGAIRGAEIASVGGPRHYNAMPLTREIPVSPPLKPRFQPGSDARRIWVRRERRRIGPRGRVRFRRVSPHRRP